MNSIHIFMVLATGCPTIIRMDRGTENVQVAAVQYAFRAYHDDQFSGSNCFRYGTSPANIVSGLCFSEDL